MKTPPMQSFAWLQESSSVATVSTFDDHLVITPAHRLGNVMTTSGADMDDDLVTIERAEAALAQLAGEFPGWMRAECARLDACRKRLNAAGSADPYGELFRAAHDIKGQAATFGYPAAAAVAACLCRLLESAPDHNRVPPGLLDQHVDGIRAIIREGLVPDGKDLAAELAASLNHLVTEFLAAETHMRGNFSGDIASPSLAPR